MENGKTVNLANIAQGINPEGAIKNLKIHLDQERTIVKTPTLIWVEDVKIQKHVQKIQKVLIIDTEDKIISGIFQTKEI